MAGKFPPIAINGNGVNTMYNDFETLSNIAMENARAGLGNIFYELREGKDALNVRRLRSCKAVMRSYGTCIVLQSYATDVALYFKNWNIVVVRAAYSATTQSHVVKFLNELDCKNVCYLYERADKCFFNCKGLLYCKYYPKTERIKYLNYYGIEQKAKLHKIINHLIAADYNL